MKTYASVSEYIKSADKAHQAKLKQVRAIVKESAPAATEQISYGMPAYKLGGEPLFYFAAMKGHLGLYPTSGPIAELKDLLKDFSTSKGCMRVPYSADMPKGIIVKLIKCRMKEIKSKKK